MVRAGRTRGKEDARSPEARRRPAPLARGVMDGDRRTRSRVERPRWRVGRDWLGRGEEEPEARVRGGGSSWTPPGTAARVAVVEIAARREAAAAGQGDFARVVFFFSFVLFFF